MLARKTAALAAAIAVAMTWGHGQAQTYMETFRPQFHFTPPQNWMNDPNGLLYYNGSYNLFYQYNPTGNNWGNISWGHAAGPDLLHWTQDPIALPFLTNGNGQLTQMNFSGSAVADVDNTSGFGTPGNPPLVAIFTAFIPNTITMNGHTILGGTQAQSIAYSLDGGVTWTQYAGNPVLPLPPLPYQSEYQNFRDPKVFWYAPDKKWVMVVSLAAQHKLLLFSSKNLKKWTEMSEFGPANAVGGVWECPDLFELPVDGSATQTEWVLTVGVNPGAVAGGSGMQYFLGQFDGTQFTADQDTLHPVVAPPGSIVFEDFNGPSYAALGWTATGQMAGTAPAPGALPGQSEVTGYHGGQFADTFIFGDESQGKLISPDFTIGKPYINFLLGGGYHPYDPATYGTANDQETAVNLVIDGHVMQTATGTNSEHLGWRSWNVTGYQGATAHIEIVDHNSGGWGHINADYFIFSDVARQEANWLDWGPDDYAGNSWNGLPGLQRVAIAWMSNWNYGGNTPTAPWRSAMTVPRSYSLHSIAGHVRLVQQPVEGFVHLDKAPLIYANGTFPVAPGHNAQPLEGVAGEALDITAVFSPGQASTFGLKVRTGTNGDETLIGYDTRSQHVFVDRFNSGQVGFDPTFPGRYTAPQAPAANGQIKLHVLVDWSSVEVFAGNGETVLTAQIFPAPTSTGVSAFATGGTAMLTSIKVSPVRSIWGP